MNPGFGGFPPEAMPFFRALKKNNTREWFQPRKEIYEEKVRGPMLKLVGALMRRLADFAPDHVGDPNKAIYRIYRDTRFSKNKTPYKTHIAAVFPRCDLQKHSGAGYYFSVSPEEIEVGGGVYMPPPEALRAIRGHLAENHKEFRRIVAAPVVKRFFGAVYGDRLTRAFAVGCRDDGRLDIDEIALLEEGMDRVGQSVAHAKGRAKGVAADPQMTYLAEKFQGVTFLLQRIGHRVRCAVY